MSNSITTPSTAEALEREWRSIGFVPGAPAHIPPATVQADLRGYRHLACPECGHRGHKVKAMHKGNDYRLLCSCGNPECGHAMEG